MFRLLGPCGPEGDSGEFVFLRQRDFNGHAHGSSPSDIGAATPMRRHRSKLKWPRQALAIPIKFA
jgi:hypothetical protein